MRFVAWQGGLAEMKRATAQLPLDALLGTLLPLRGGLLDHSQVLVAEDLECLFASERCLRNLATPDDEAQLDPAKPARVQVGLVRNPCDPRTVDAESARLFEIRHDTLCL